MRFLNILLLSAIFIFSNVAFSSFNQDDITNFNKGEPVSKNSLTHGYKFGQAKCVFDPSGDSDLRTIAAHGCGLTIPKDAIVTFVAYDVLTTFTSATDAATIAVKIVGANDVVSALAISDVSNIWDAGIFETIPKVETSTTWLTTTADSEVTFTVAVEALTAGKLVLWVQWMYFGDA